MSLVIVEARTGAQVLPNIHDPGCGFSSWEAHCALDADQRATSPAHKQLAANLLVKEATR